MSSFNKVILMGNLTRDPELRSTQAGASVCRITLATSRQFKAGDGSQREETAFIDCDAWGRTADTIAQYCQKGRPLLVEGRLKQEKWEDKKTGEKRTKLVVSVESFSFVGGEAPGERRQDAPSVAGYSAAAPRAKGNPDGYEQAAANNEDIPF